MRSDRERLAAAIAVLAILAGPSAGHEVRPGFLELEETAAGEFNVLWKVPTRNGLRLRMDPLFPEGCEQTSPIDAYDAPGALVETWNMSCAGSLIGQSIRILGLEATLTDVLMRIETAEQSIYTARLNPSSPSWTVPAAPSRGELTGAYLWLGIEHILLGVDHLLFVLGLLLLVDGPWRLVKTITAFTVAHSITLASATVGLVLLDERAVNAAIALSILFLGVEILRSRDGHAALTGRHPWAVAFAFGLLHGLGFASALTELGLPASDIPVALLLFNVGVEIGQIGFVLLILALLRSFVRLEMVWPTWSRSLPAYVIGSMGAFWFVGRF
ncbi:MAG: HupE/UreJ family protein, partial [Acidobacteriota bacterium]|nr:HupE/UreJ family protein [Acidobacteriota bacterium]